MQRNANMLKIIKKVGFYRFYGFLCKNTVPSLSPEKTFVPRGDFTLDCILNSYNDFFILFMAQKMLHRKVTDLRVIIFDKLTKKIE